MLASGMATGWGHSSSWALQWLRGFAKRVSVKGTAAAALDVQSLPQVAIVGRPNVGKSALYNKLVRRAAAVVYDTPNSHVTRDYKEGLAHLGDLFFRVFDTSGLEPHQPTSTIQGRTTELTARVLSSADLALFVIDAKDGLVAHDQELARWLHRHFCSDRVILVANKAENQRARQGMSQTVADAYCLGFGEPVAVSSTTGEGMADLFVTLQPQIDALRQQKTGSPMQAPIVDSGDSSQPGFACTQPPGALQAVAQCGSSAGSSNQMPTLSSAKTRTGHTDDSRNYTIVGEVGSAAERSTGSIASASAAGSEVDSKTGSSDVGNHAGVQHDAERAGQDTQDEAGALEPAGTVRMALMGLPNVGKSTLLNCLLKERRSLTGPEPGLTRDCVRVATTLDGVAVELVDTAGWIGQTHGGRYDDVGGAIADMARQESARALGSVHVVVLVLDCERALKTQLVLASRELSLATLILEEGKALVIAANKIDLLPSSDRKEYLDTLQRRLGERFVEAGQLPIVEISAASGAGVEDLMPTVLRTHAAWNRRVTTGRLNRFVQKLAARLVGTGGTNRTMARVKYVTQIKARPPSFSVFLSGSKQVPEEFDKFLAQQIRLVLGFQGVPVRLWYRFKEKHNVRMERLQKEKKAANRLPPKAMQLPGHSIPDAPWDSLESQMAAAPVTPTAMMPQQLLEKMGTGTNTVPTAMVKALSKSRLSSSRRKQLFQDMGAAEESAPARPAKISSQLLQWEHGRGAGHAVQEAAGGWISGATSPYMVPAGAEAPEEEALNRLPRASAWTRRKVPMASRSRQQQQHAGQSSASAYLRQLARKPSTALADMTAKVHRNTLAR